MQWSGGETCLLPHTDVYHRILRFQNYLVAMINKKVLPCKFYIPFFGEKYERSIYILGVRVGVREIIYIYMLACIWTTYSVLHFALFLLQNFLYTWFKVEL